MRIGVVTSWFPTTRHRGAGSFVATDARVLAESFDVEVLHLAPPELDDGVRDLLLDGVPVARVPMDVRRPSQWARARGAIEAFVGERDVLHTMAAPMLLPFILERPRIPWVHTEHWSGVANWAGTGRSALLRPMTRRAFEGPDHVVAVSGYLAAAVRRLRSRPVSVIGNVVESSEVRHQTLARDSPHRGIRMLGIGTVNAHKGWRIAVEALSVLRREGIEAELLWLGQGPDLESLRETSLSLPVTAPGHVDRGTVQQALEQADVLVLPTASETFSMVTVEALVAGVPVVATGSGGHRELITAGSGLLVQRTPAALAAGVQAAAHFASDTVRARGAALAREHSPVKFRHSYAEVYRKVSLI